MKIKYDLARGADLCAVEAHTVRQSVITQALGEEMTSAPTLELMKPATELVESYRSSGTCALLDKPLTMSLDAEVASMAPTTDQDHSAGTAVITSAHYARLLDAIRTLKLEPDEDDRPTDFASDLAVKLLSATAAKLALEFPAGYVAVGPLRSLRINWADRGRQVRLVCGGGPHNKTYLYLEHGQRHGVASRVSGDEIASSLRWLAAS